MTAPPGILSPFRLAARERGEPRGQRLGVTGYRLAAVNRADLIGQEGDAEVGSPAGQSMSTPRMASSTPTSFTPAKIPDPPEPRKDPSK